MSCYHVFMHDSRFLCYVPHDFLCCPSRVSVPPLKKNSKVPGALFEISKSDEKKLDVYEDYPILYKKYYFKYYGKKVMTYTMTNKTPFRYPTERYLNVIKQGYKNCKLDKSFLKKILLKAC